MILDSVRIEENEEKHSEFREGYFAVWFHLFRNPPYLRESHVPFLGYLLLCGIAASKQFAGHITA